MKEIYDDLNDAISGLGMGQHKKTPELYAMLEALYSEKEAELVAKMPPSHSTLEEITGAVGMSSDETKARIESAIKKGTVFYTFSKKRQAVVYSPFPLVPGVFENQFMSGEVSDRTKKMARLFEDWFKSIDSDASSKTRGPRVPFARVIPVEEEIRSASAIYPYEVLSEYIKKAENICVSVCYCRHQAELIGNPCEKPKEVCMSFGPTAVYIDMQGYGRPVSKEEALEILQLSETEGLVHCASNTSKYLDFICNCCICHCGILRTLKQPNINLATAVSGYIIEADRQACSGCEICVERCPAEILSVEEGTVNILADSCLGCGLCTSTCPENALKMVNRSEQITPPADQLELALAGVAAYEND
jgi:Na+-translocating ferredoxin:NAD+ oxidoreductase subunit B